MSSHCSTKGCCFCDSHRGCGCTYTHTHTSPMHTHTRGQSLSRSLSPPPPSYTHIVHAGVCGGQPHQLAPPSARRGWSKHFTFILPAQIRSVDLNYVAGSVRPMPLSRPNDIHQVFMAPPPSLCASAHSNSVCLFSTVGHLG